MKKKQPAKRSVNFSFSPGDYPSDPGCYLMKNSKGQVIYVGKAKNLRRRLSYYFRTRRQYYKTKRMVPRIHNVEVILVNNETESLILENNLIKHYKPRYNSMLIEDDVGYPFIVLTGEEFPRLLPYRRNWSNKQWSETKGQEEGKKFGPYLNKVFRDAVMNFTIETFGLRICRTLPKKICFRYQLKKCNGICEGLVSPAEYREAVRLAVELLEYRYSEILTRFRNQMDSCADNLDFESAAKLRDRIMIIENFLAKQLVERDEKFDQDVLFFGDNHVMVMEIKRGMLLKFNFFNLPAENDHQITCKEFLLRHYREKCPDELIVNTIKNIKTNEKQSFSNNKTPVRITVPDQGIKMDLLMLCRKNYEYRLKVAQSAGHRVQV